MQIHWFAVINSALSVLLLTAVLAVILMRTLRADFMRYSLSGEDGGGGGGVGVPLGGADDDECGWKCARVRPTLRATALIANARVSLAFAYVFLSVSGNALHAASSLRVKAHVLLSRAQRVSAQVRARGRLPLPAAAGPLLRRRRRRHAADGARRRRVRPRAGWCDLRTS